MILERLKSATGDAHDRVEALAASDRIMNGTLTAGEYRRLVLRNYLLHAAYEPLLDTVAARYTLDELRFQERKKLPFLERDLRELNLRIPGVEFIPSLVPDTVQQVLGCMYVLEGSTLGGAVIRRRLTSIPEFAGIPFHFYGCYGDRTGAMWNSFRSVLTARVQTTAEQQETVQAALQMFDDVARCFSMDVPVVE